jgi:hypothetical protein
MRGWPPAAASPAAIIQAASAPGVSLILRLHGTPGTIMPDSGTGAPAKARRGGLRRRRSRAARACGTTPASKPRSRKTRTASRPRSPISTVMSLTHIPTKRSATAGSIPRAKLIAYSRACGRWASECRTVSRTRRVSRAIISGPRSRRTALPPSGRGSPVSSFHHAPRSSDPVEAVAAVGELPLVDDQAHVGPALAHLVEDAVERHHAGGDAGSEEAQGEAGGGERARHGHGPSRRPPAGRAARGPRGAARSRRRSSPRTA